MVDAEVSDDVEEGFCDGINKLQHHHWTVSQNLLTPEAIAL